MTEVMVIGFIDIEEKSSKRPSTEYTVRFRPEDLIRIDYNMLFDTAWRNGLRSICRAKGYYPSGKHGAKDGGRFDPVYIVIDQQMPSHMVGGPPIDNRKNLV